MSFLSKKSNIKIKDINAKGIIKSVGRNPHLDWFVILFISFVVMLILGVSATNLFFKIKRGDIKGEDIKTGANMKIVNKKDISSIISVFDSKEALTKEIKKGYEGMSDPSL